jgi:hypothetical protein
MPILLKTATGDLVVDLAEFANESELESVLADTPSLLVRPSDPPLAFVHRQVDLPEAGLLDLLFVTSTGLPVAVEVKLLRNGESRRQVVAQVIDYVSSLTQMTVDELDITVGGALDVAVHQLVEQAGGSFDQVWQQVGANLRAGLARVVLALDEVPPELERIVRFLAERSNLDVRLVTVAKFAHPSQGTLYVPSFVVDASEERLSQTPQGAKVELLAAVTAYDADASPDLRSKGKGTNYRQIKPPGWPGGIHYEFYQTAKDLGTELHLEGEKVAYLAAQLSPFDGTALKTGSRLMWDPNWGGGKGRLAVKHPLNTEPSTVALDMHALIGATRDLVSDALRRRSVAASTP